MENVFGLLNELINVDSAFKEVQKVMKQNKIETVDVDFEDLDELVQEISSEEDDLSDDELKRQFGEPCEENGRVESPIFVPPEVVEEPEAVKEIEEIPSTQDYSILDEIPATPHPVQVKKRKLDKPVEVKQKEEVVDDDDVEFVTEFKSGKALENLINPNRRSEISKTSKSSDFVLFRSPLLTKPDKSQEPVPQPEEKNILDSEELAEKCPNIEPKLIEIIKNEIIDQSKPIDWNDISGLEYPKTIIREAVVNPLLRPDLFTGLRKPPKGILLFGPPGTGKTLIGKCIASQSKATFFSISASSLTSKYVGESEKLVRALFVVANHYEPSVVFVDEIDSLLTQRHDGEHESSRRLKTEFLIQLDGAATSDDARVLIVGATNRPQELDEAARRRLTKRLYIPLPELKDRIEMIQKLLNNNLYDIDDAELNMIGEGTTGFSGADIKCLCQEASMEPIRSLPQSSLLHIKENEIRPVNYSDFESALKRVKATVSSKDLVAYEEWDKQFGAGS